MFPSRRIAVMGSDKFRDEHSVSFDGTDEYIDCGDSSDFHFSNGSVTKFSISLWFKHDTGSPANNETLIGKYDVGLNKREWRLSTHSDDTFGFWVSANGSSPTASYTSYVLADTNWHHIVVTYDGSVGTANLRCQMYVDGVDYVTTGSSSNMAELNQEEAPLIIGGYTSSGSISSSWGGNISEVAIYNSPLTASQVKTLYNDGDPYNHKEGIASNNLVAWYRMGDGTLDQKSNAHSHAGIICDEVSPTLGSDLLGGKGDFSDASYWTVTSGQSEITGGLGKFLGNGGYGVISKGSLTTSGKMYCVDIDCVSNAGASVRQNNSDPYPMLVRDSETGSFRAYYLANGTNFIMYSGENYTSIMHIDNVILREVGGNPGAMINHDSRFDITGDAP